ncbi:MAG: hypothetical protein IJG13_14595, partial [Kiritimatiellae bacterium]|nr:hypothetical protein [Kiritimatiellia bacterium]
MTDGMVRLVFVGALVSLALPAWLLVGCLWRKGVHPFREAARFLPRGVVECLLLVSFFCGLVHRAASKVTNAPPQGASPPMLIMGAKPASSPLFNSASVTTNGTWD